jgi:hypothetical protein
LLGAWWKFDHWGVEVTTNSAYEAGVEELLRSSALPPIFNGLQNNDGGLPISGDTMYLPYSSGGLNENCMQDVLGPMHDRPWLFTENTMLYTTQQHKWAICEAQSTNGNTDNRRDRTYFLASWWLTYDPNYSVAFPRFALGGTPEVFVFPEYALVPTQPIQTATTSVSNLLTSTGAYARQFAQCFNNGVYVGACAAIVNPSSTATVTLPGWATSSYHHSLALSMNNTYVGGTIWWSSAIPRTLAPMTATILSQ